MKVNVKVALALIGLMVCFVESGRDVTIAKYNRDVMLEKIRNNYHDDCQ